MMELYNFLFYRPIFNLLIGIYDLLPGHDIGIAIIVLTILIRVVLFPFTLSSLKSQKALQSIQPKMNEIRQKYKNEKEKMAKALMELYSKEKVNPASSCLPLLIQLPVFIALYQALRTGLAGERFELLYSFVSRPETIDVFAFGFVNLSQPNLIFALFAGLTQFWQAKSLPYTKQPKVSGGKDEDMLAMMNRQMIYFMPAITVFIGFSLPGGVMLYWLTSNILTILQQYVFLRKKDKEKRQEQEQKQDQEVL